MHKGLCKNIDCDFEKAPSITYSGRDRKNLKKRFLRLKSLAAHLSFWTKSPSQFGFPVCSQNSEINLFFFIQKPLIHTVLHVLKNHIRITQFQSSPFWDIKWAICFSLLNRKARQKKNSLRPNSV